MNKHEQLAEFHQSLRVEKKSVLQQQVKSLLACGVEFGEIAPLVWDHIADKSVADPSWLPAASSVNFADSLIQVPLQLPQHQHHAILFGEPSPEFRRTEPPPPLEGTLEELRSRLNEISATNDWLLTERCLLGIAFQSNVETAFRCIVDQLLRPEYLGTRSGAWWTELRLVTVRCQFEIWKCLGDEAIRLVLCRNGARQCARKVGVPGEQQQDAIRLLAVEYEKQGTRATLAEDAFDEASFRGALLSPDLETVFGAITDAWQRGVSIEQISLAMTMLCVERHLRAAHGERRQWCDLRNELMAAANSLKLAELDETLAIRAAYHAAWLIYENGSEGLADEIPAEAAPPNADASKQLETIIELVSQGNPPTAIAESNSYAASGHDGIEFLRRLFLAIGHDFTYAGQRCMTEAWYAGESHPERNRILAATVGAEAHYRMREDC